MDLFEKWLNNKESKWIKRALTDPSFNNFRSKGIRKNDPRFKELSTPLPDNKDLALLGDAIIRFIYANYLLDKVDHISIEKAKVESDKYLVEVVAKHYNLLDYIQKDFDDWKLPSNYNYRDSIGLKNRHKYIATAVEAVIGAIFREGEESDDNNCEAKYKNEKAIKELVISWISLNQESSK